MSGSASDTNNRTLFSIVSSCLATVFACTWVSVHPNVPRPSQSNLALSWRRFCLMLVAVIAPELMAGFAARQFLDARWFSKKYDVSLTHGFFLCYGWICVSKWPPSYRRRDIEDKSKGDSLSKGVVVLQGLWFAATWRRWRSNLSAYSSGSFGGTNPSTCKSPFVLDPPMNLGLGPSDDIYLELQVSTWRWCELLPMPENPVLLGDCSAFDPIGSTSVPLFWSTHGFYCKGGSGKGDIHFVSMFTFVQFLAGTIFGLIHCGAWNAHFPSADEMLIWRCCALVVCATPFSLTFFFLFWVLSGKKVDAYSVREPLEFTRLGSTFGVVANTCTNITIGAYIVARLLLIALSFTTLCALPPGAFVDVNWSTYIPNS
ncbi:hypothetical protein B0H14DRAFT_3699765 [Mycena olivaceomarginata]|nr:hypothetical protein B0H14DRAFT_3699765 [Mycena olivaceomarginata]